MMKIAHDIAALNTQRQLKIQTDKKSTKAGRLSSGYRINSSADDAAGLSISEKMRAMIRGLNRASLNAQEGISLLQVGDGALNETHDMLHRLTELSIQSANDTYTDNDRGSIQAEVDQLCSDIQRISRTTTFNTIALFKSDEGPTAGPDAQPGLTPALTADPAFSQADGAMAGAAFPQTSSAISSSADVTDGYGFPTATSAANDSVFPADADATDGYGFPTDLAASSGNVPDSATASAAPSAGLDTAPELTAASPGLSESDAPGDGIDIFYTTVTRVDDFDTTQAPSGSSTLASDITIEGKKLSEILKTEIIPNTVNNILQNYPAFSYLKNSGIGIGLEYFSAGASGGTTTLAYVEGTVSSSGTSSGGVIVSRKDVVTYTLGVNTSVLNSSMTRADLAELEATIAHEMIHAFMDEALTSGMFGTMEGTSTLTTDVEPFPDWFIEGMAQTASGPGNWLQSRTFNLSAASTESDIKRALTRNALNSGTTASQYGTGYLACMYLGAVIAGGGSASSTVDAATISDGLTQLLNQVIGGDSLDTAINKLTNGMYADTYDFSSRFGPSNTDAITFIKNLLVATGNGRGGIVSGDLTATDLTPDTDLGNTVRLFQLDPNHTGVENTYPNGYKVYSGGSLDTPGVVPPGFTPAPVGTEYGDFLVQGAAAGDVTYDAGTNTLTVNGGNVRVSLKNGVSSSANGRLVLNGGNTTLLGVNLTAADALTVNTGAGVTYAGVNRLGGIVNNNSNVTFRGTGRLEAGAFTNNGANTVCFQGGAVSIGTNGSGTISAADIIIDNASVTANLTSTPKNSAGQTLSSIDLPWSRLAGLTTDIVSIAVDGSTTLMTVGNAQKATLWLTDTGATQPVRHKVTITDAVGFSQNLIAELDNAVPPSFHWAIPYQLQKKDASGALVAAQEGVDYTYEGNTLVIQKAGDYTLANAPGSRADTDRSVRLADNLKDVSLTLNGVNNKPSTGSGLDLGDGNNVTLKLGSNSNIFHGGTNHAGVELGNNTSLVIENAAGVTNGSIEAYGGSGGAGIGAGNNNAISGSSIEIKSGGILATGGGNGAGIGAARQSGFGDIRITGGTVTANGGSGSAGIGAANYGAAGNITITGGTIKARGGIGGAGIGGGDEGNVGNIVISGTPDPNNPGQTIGPVIDASSKQHGAGIGGGWGRTVTNGTITISAGEITASSTEHGTGIGAGCSGASGKITITGSAHIVKAHGGESGAGIGASWNGDCGDIEISGNAVIEDARGGDYGAGIGSGNLDSHAGNIVINTDGKVQAYGGNNGVGIGSGYSEPGRLVSDCGDIDIKKGTVLAEGQTDSTGIGSGRGSTSGNITIGDKNNPDNKVIVTATGGMSNNGGNILSYTDRDHTAGSEGKLTVAGNNTTIRPGAPGEGLYSTSGAVDPNGTQVYAYPVYLFKDNNVLDAGKKLDGFLPLDEVTGVGRDDISNIRISSDKGLSWTPGMSHNPHEENYVFLWLPKGDQKLTITYDYMDSAGNTQSGSTVLDLKFYPDAGVFRIAQQDVPKPAEKPGYITNPPPVNPVDPPSIDNRPEADGIILHIGAGTYENLVIPRFQLSLASLGIKNLDVSTRENAELAIAAIEGAVSRVSRIRSAYGAYQNRLEHTVRNLEQTSENTAAGESRIRDADMAKEMVDYSALSILAQVAMAMQTHNKQNRDQVMTLLQTL